ncbi:serine protease easter [Ceratitis capitata]|uniref:CLIP domain-containing serine protease n=1 Tax=Ceratitis capitata TaxID=7213 RepID=W8C934_CERCA|nr:serine protease easter [Ceratitis capitata]
MFIFNSLLLLCLYTANNVVVAITYGPCDSPFNGKGVCVQISECQFIKDIVNGPLNADLKDKVQKSQCGYDNTFKENSKRILVCCPERHMIDTKSNVRSNVGDGKGNILPAAGVCGTSLTDFIYGGEKTRILDYPWVALLRYKTRANNLVFLCGGSLINTRYVLTAAHCLSQGNHLLHSVRLGEWDTRTDPDCEVDINGKKSCAPPFIELGIERKISHPNYISESKEQFYDVGLIRLEGSVTYTNFLRPICLPASREFCENMFVNTTMEVAGWGATNKPHANSSPVKLSISVRVWETFKCHDIYKTVERSIDSAHHLCAGGIGGFDSCRGDSGGPLMLPELLNNRYVYFAAGVISFGPSPCGSDGWPGVYARIGSYVEWIQSSLEP